MIVNPDGLVLQEAGTQETILPDVLDLDHVTRTREQGMLGLNQTLKQLRDCEHQFPIYQDGAQGQGFSGLGTLGFHH
jgi:hypothetical protein